MDIVTFGDGLLKTGDLDPVYIAVHGAELDWATQCRLVLAYWCFYHLGHAAYLADIKQPKRYWEAMMHSARNEGHNADGSKPWPRGAERRHFRGQQAISAVEELTLRYKTPEAAVEGLTGLDDLPRLKGGVLRVHGPGDLTFSSVSEAAKGHRGFGDWIAFKVADMADRVLNLEVDFSNCELGVYKDPRQGAALARYYRLGMDKTAPMERPWQLELTDVEFAAECAHWVKFFRSRKHKAPPLGDRLVNIQEVETIFCKWKSHMKGHYPLGKDSREIRHGLEEWAGRSKLAARLLEHLPRVAVQTEMRL